MPLGLSEILAARAYQVVRLPYVRICTGKTSRWKLRPDRGKGGISKQIMGPGGFEDLT